MRFRSSIAVLLNMVPSKYILKILYHYFDNLSILIFLFLIIFFELFSKRVLTRAKYSATIGEKEIDMLQNCYNSNFYYGFFNFGFYYPESFLLS